MEHPKHILAWAAMQHAIEDGDTSAAEKYRQEWITALTNPQKRNDAEEPKPAPAPESDEIDWAKVAREAQAMVDLNKDAMSKWQKGSKVEQ